MGKLKLGSAEEVKGLVGPRLMPPLENGNFELVSVTTGRGTEVPVNVTEGMGE